MKTPRDILLEQHKEIAPELDEIRRAVVGKLNKEATKRQGYPAVFVSSFLRYSKTMWHELVLPSRRVWAGLTAVWLVIFAVNISMCGQMRTPKATLSPDMIFSLRQQEQLLTELVGPNDAPVAEPAKPDTSHPTSLRCIKILMT